MANKDHEKEFLQAYDELSSALFRYCFFKTRDRELAKDILQDTFMKTWAYIQAGNKVKNLKAFLYRSANNLIIDWYRKQKMLSLDALTEEGFDPPDPFSHTEIAAELEQAMKVLSTLEQSDQDIIIWRYVDELSVGEIAAILSEKENTISVRLHRAIGR